MKKYALVFLMAASVLSKADMVGKLQLDFGVSQEIRSREEDSKFIKRGDTVLKEKPLLGSPKDTAYKASLENLSVHTNARLDLGFDNFGLKFGGEIGTQPYSYLPGNFSYLKIDRLGKDWFDASNVANVYVEYSDKDVFLKPKLNLTYYFAQKSLPFYQTYKKDQINFYESIEHNFENGLRVNQSLTVNANKSGDNHQFSDAELNLQASGFAGNGILVIGRARVKYIPNSGAKNLRINDVILGNTYRDLLKPLEKSDTQDSKMSKTDNDEYVGYSKELFYKKQGVESESDVLLEKNEMYNNWITKKEDNKYLSTNEYRVQFRPSIQVRSYKVSGYVPSVLVEYNFEDKNYFQTFDKGKIDKANEEIKEKNKAITDETKKIAEINLGDYNMTSRNLSHKLIVSPQVDIKSIKDTFIKLQLRTEYERDLYVRKAELYKNNVIQLESNKKEVRTDIIVFNPSVEVEYTKKLRPSTELTLSLYGQYRLKALVNNSAKYEVVEAVTENGNTENKYVKKTFQLQNRPIEKLVRDKDGNVFLKEDTERKNPKSLSELTYNETTTKDPGDKLLKETVEKFDNGILDQEIKLAPSVNVKFDLASGVSLNTNLTAALSFSKGYIKPIKLDKIEIVPSLALTYEW